ncbi:MAG: ADP-ribose pyrophosphatase, partial [Lachnospiraceae bacterium]
MHLEEKTLRVEEIYNGKIFRVTRETAQVENGDQVFREVVHHSGGVCVVALTDNEEIIFVRQFRYPFQKVLLEVPA